jgi:hypothetical protein
MKYGMANRMTWLGLLLGLLFSPLISSCRGEDFVGSWSNGKEGFYTQSFGLRKDGRGFFSAAIATGYIRWERSAEGIVIHVPGDGKTEQIKLTYDKRTGSFYRQIPQGNPEQFNKVSSDDPPDFEAQWEEERQKELQARPAYVLKKQELPSREELLTALEAWAKRVPPNPGGASGLLSCEDTKLQFSVSQLEKSYMIEVPLLHKALDSLTPGLYYSNPLSTEKPDLPVRYQLSESQVARLQKCLTDQNLAFSERVLEMRGPWKIEAYRKVINTGVNGDTESTLKICRTLVNELFKDSKGPFVFSTSERASGTGQK